MKKRNIYSIFITLLIFSSWSSFAINNDQSIKKSENKRIDTHIHLYDTNREGSCAFLNPEKNKKIYFPHLTDQFVNTASPSGVGFAIVVEASKRREDNIWLLDLVERSDELLGCTVNLDPSHPEFKADVEKYLKYKKFRGMRIRPAKPVDLSDPEIIEALGVLSENNLVLELGHNPRTTDKIVAIAKKYPKLTIIINHLANGRIQDGKVVPESWYSAIQKLAAEPNITCKVSMIYHLSGQNPAPTNMEYYKPLIDPVVEAFGVKRVMFGSNWTLSEMRGSYSDIIKIFDAYCDQNKKLSHDLFYRKNAIDIYGIEPGF